MQDSLTMLLIVRCQVVELSLVSDPISRKGRAVDVMGISIDVNHFN